MAAGPPPAFLQQLLAASQPPKLFTLAIPTRRAADGGGTQLLLGRKLRGFGQGLWNGFGGKVHDGEGIASAAARELHEEAGVVARAGAVTPRGVLHFGFDDQPRLWEVHVFHVGAFDGEPHDTDEMAPRWFDAERELPALLAGDQMWADDRHWYPLFMRGALFHGVFGFSDTTRLVWHRLRECADEHELLEVAAAAARGGGGGGATAAAAGSSAAAAAAAEEGAAAAECGGGGGGGRG